MLLKDRDSRKPETYSDEISSFQYKQVDPTFTHTNMVPHFKKSPYNVFDQQYDSKLEQLQGDGAVRKLFFKTEQAPLFEPQRMRDPNRNANYEEVYEQRRALAGDNPHLLHQNERPPGTGIFVGRGNDHFYNKRAFGDVDYDPMNNIDEGYEYGRCPTYSFWRPDELTREERTGKTRPTFDVSKQILAGLQPTFHSGLSAIKIRELITPKAYKVPEGMTNVNGLVGTGFKYGGVDGLLWPEFSKKIRDKPMFYNQGNIKDLGGCGVQQTGLPQIKNRKTPLKNNELGLPTLTKQPGHNETAHYDLHDPLLFSSRGQLDRLPKIKNYQFPTIVNTDKQVRNEDDLINRANYSTVNNTLKNYNAKTMPLKQTVKDSLLYHQANEPNFKKFYITPELYDRYSKNPKRVDYLGEPATYATGNFKPGVAPNNLISRDPRKPIYEKTTPGFLSSRGIIVKTDEDLNRIADKKITFSQPGGGGKLITNFNDDSMEIMRMPDNKNVYNVVLGPNKINEQIHKINGGNETRNKFKNEINQRQTF
jgi:hypothetical protein